MVGGTSELDVHQAEWEGRERVLEFKREGEVGDSGWQMRDGMLEICEKLQVGEGGQRRERVIEAFVER